MTDVLKKGGKCSAPFRRVDLKVVRPLVVTDLNGDKGHNEIGTDGLKAIIVVRL